MSYQLVPSFVGGGNIYCNKYVIQICSGITSGRVLFGELSCTKILEVNMFAFAYRLFHEDFSPINVDIQFSHFYYSDNAISNLCMVCNRKQN